MVTESLFEWAIARDFKMKYKAIKSQPRGLANYAVLFRNRGSEIMSFIPLCSEQNISIRFNFGSLDSFLNRAMCHVRL
jgi:hypothetical protein